MAQMAAADPRDAEIKALRSQVAQLQEQLRTLTVASKDHTSDPENTDDGRRQQQGFGTPQLHHINLVSRVPTELHSFYTEVLAMEPMPAPVSADSHPDTTFSMCCAESTRIARIR
jgi:hypothetical protein